LVFIDEFFVTLELIESIPGYRCSLTAMGRGQNCRTVEKYSAPTVDGRKRTRCFSSGERCTHDQRDWKSFSLFRESRQLAVISYELLVPPPFG